MGAHSKWSASASKRWICCPGSVEYSEQFPDETSSYAAEGTAAHELGEMCLKAKHADQDPEHYRGQIIEADGQNFIVDDDMINAVQFYVDEVARIVALEQAKGHTVEVHVEKRFDLGWLWKGMFGTNDCCIYAYGPDGYGKLYVLDYKHGRGVAVYSEWNSQLMIYGLGALHNTFGINDVELIVVQPRCDKRDEEIDRFNITSTALYDWGVNILRAAAIRTTKPEAPLLAGTHCKFCKAIPLCPKYKEFVAPAMPVALPSPKTCTPEQLATMLERVEAAEGFIKDLKSFALTQVTSGAMTLPNRKLVAGRSNRKWSDRYPNAVETKLTSCLGDGAYAARKLLSPAQAEKALKRAGLSPEAILAPLVVKPQGKPTLVARDDKRKEIASPNAPSEVFSNFQ